MHRKHRQYSLRLSGTTWTRKSSGERVVTTERPSSSSWLTPAAARRDECGGRERHYKLSANMRVTSSRMLALFAPCVRGSKLFFFPPQKLGGKTFVDALYDILDSNIGIRIHRRICNQILFWSKYEEYKMSRRLQLNVGLLLLIYYALISYF